MAGLTEGLKVAFAAYIEGILTNPNVQNKLKEKDFPVQTRIKELTAKRKDYEKKESVYRELVARKRQASEEANEFLSSYYQVASSIADELVAVLGRDDALSKEIRNWRDRMILEAKRGKKRGQQP